jgi:tetratricopeptide (TPR) repeat protein
MQRPEKKIMTMTDLIEQARRNDPFNALYPYSLANLKRHQKDNAAALSLYTTAAMLQPLQGTYLQNIAQLLADTDLSRAEQLMEQGYVRALHKSDSLQRWIAFALTIKKDRHEAIRLMRKALSANLSVLPAAYSLMTKHNFTQQEIMDILPETASAWLQYWNIARTGGREEEARFFIEHALEHIDKEGKKPQPQLFVQVYSYYQQKKEEQAIEALREGIRRLPNYAPFHITLGDWYYSKGIAYRALEEYEQARLLLPGSASLQEKIKKLKAR